MDQNYKEKMKKGGPDDPLIRAAAQRDRNIVDMVAAAIKHHNTMLAYQPVVQSSDPGKIAFYEGLIRVKDATGRVIPARDFITTIEDTELGRDLDCNALRHGLRVLKNNPELRLSINMSARSIGYKPWMRILNRFLSENAALAERLILEITEASAITVPELVIGFMDDLQDRGIAFALDDFGAGFTSFRYLRSFFFDAVKIDGQFVRGIHANPDNQILTKSLVSIAKHFEMLCVAESVESREDAEFLISIGVDCLQGYLFGAPTVRQIWRPHHQRQQSA